MIGTPWRGGSGPWRMRSARVESVEDRMSMKLGYLIPEFASQTHIIFWREITQLREMGVEVTIYSSRRPPAGSCPHEFAKAAEAETLYAFPPSLAASIPTLATRPAGVFRGLCYLAGLKESPVKDRVKRLGLLLCAAVLARDARRRGVEHIHAQSCAEVAHLAALCHLLGGPPFSLTLHGDLEVYGTDHRSKMARASFVLVVGRHLKEQVLQRVGLDGDRVVTTFMGIDTEKFHDAGRRDFQSGRLHVVSVGRLNRAKGYSHGLAAVRRAVDRGHDVTYTIVGEGPYRAEVEADVARLGLSDRVRLAGMRSESQIVALLQEADAFLLSSVGAGEAYPSVVIEAMASGLPVVCSIIGATPEMITHDVDGVLVPQADEPALIEALVRLAERPEERRRLGEAARRRARETYDRRVSATRLLEHIETSPCRPAGRR